jgi:hypothetical protein
MTSPVSYKWIRVAGLLTLIPIVLAAAPLAGYIAGDWLIYQFGFPRHTTIVCVIIGFAASVRETIKIIQAALKATKEIQ